MLTELSIVNNMLAATGVEAVVSSDTDHPDYQAAKLILDDVILSTQKLGLWYNTSYPTLNANLSGEILLTAKALHVDPCDTSLRYVKRGLKLYDLGTRTYNFGSPFCVQVKYIENLLLTEMPETAKDYVKYRAVAEYYDNADGDDRKIARLEQRKEQAWVELWREHLRNRDVNQLVSPSLLRMRHGTIGGVSINRVYNR